MFERVRIQNYRALSDLEIGRLSRIDLFLGRNDSGKTSLLEALFLLCGTPQLAVDSKAIRELSAGSATPVTGWRPLFADSDGNRTIGIEGRHDRFGRMKLRLDIDRPRTMEFSPDGSGRASLPGVSSSTSLRFSFETGSGKRIESRIRMVEGGFETEPAPGRPTIPAVLVSPRTGSPREDLARLGRLRQEEQTDLVVDALRIVEPRLLGIEGDSASGGPTIWADLGLPELIPLPVMGNGMTRIARMVLAISAAPNGIVLVDEIENGIHHSTLPEVRGVIEATARRFDTQIVATTHSFECLEAAHRTVDGADLRVHRLEIGRAHV